MSRAGQGYHVGPTRVGRIEGASEILASETDARDLQFPEPLRRPLTSGLADASLISLAMAGNERAPAIVAAIIPVVRRNERRFQSMTAAGAKVFEFVHSAPFIRASKVAQLASASVRLIVTLETSRFLFLSFLVFILGSG